LESFVAIVATRDCASKRIGAAQRKLQRVFTIRSMAATGLLEPAPIASDLVSTARRAAPLVATMDARQGSSRWPTPTRAR
jgi:hypothetical protein